MAPTLLHILFRLRRWIAAATLTLWRGLSPLFPQRRGPRLMAPADAMPMTDEQRRSRKTEFIQSINKDAICALASRHNGGLPCRLDGSPAHGSYNICYFIEFYTIPERTQWVVRVPISTVLHCPWEKLQSEVCTIQYLQAHTTIPIPQVYAYGRARLQQDTADKICYMIMERAGGRPLDGLKFLEASEEQRQRLCSDLIIALAQLRNLTFKAAGSLMPSSLTTLLPRWLWAPFSPNPVIVSAISIPLNDLQVEADGTLSPQSPPTSVDGFLSWTRRWLWDLYLMPSQDLGESTAQYELFALQMLLQHLPPSKDSKGQPEQFVLTHSDLRGPNIMVDDKFHIQAIIDWEWAATVPINYFTPPHWFMDHTKAQASFFSALALFPSSDPSISLLQKEWLHPDSNNANLTQHMGRIFQHPYSLPRIFYRSIYPQLYNIPSERARDDFFCLPRWQEEIKHRVQNSERYREYLKANGLYEVNEEAVKEKAFWVEKMAELEKLRKSNK